MARIEWTDQLSVGIPKIDQQHKGLIDLINTLGDSAMQEEKNKKILEDSIEKLMDYTKFHFSTEEYLMRQVKYTGYASHVKEHEAFVAKVSSFYNDFLDNKAELDQAIVDYLINWVINHIQTIDKMYMPYLSEVPKT